MKPLIKTHLIIFALSGLIVWQIVEWLRHKEDNNIPKTHKVTRSLWVATNDLGQRFQIEVSYRTDSVYQATNLSHPFGDFQYVHRITYDVDDDLEVVVINRPIQINRTNDLILGFETTNIPSRPPR